MTTSKRPESRKLSESQIHFRLRRNLVGRSSGLALEHLGCSLAELRKHLEAQFSGQMCWENYGTHGWQVDHIAPLAATDDYYERLKLHHYTNLRPLWARQNQRKGAKNQLNQTDSDQQTTPAKAIETLRVHTGEGQPFSAAGAAKLGCSSALLSYHEKSGNLLRLGRGVFMFPHEHLDPLYTVAFYGKSVPDLHIGAESALAWHKRDAPSAFGKHILVATQKRMRQPNWWKHVATCLVLMNRTPFVEGEIRYSEQIHAEPNALKGARIASPELALIEVLNDVGTRLRLSDAQTIVAQLHTIDLPNLVRLLQVCRRVKIVRLCLKWSVELGVPWADELAEKLRQSTAKASKRWSRRYSSGERLNLG